MLSFINLLLKLIWHLTQMFGYVISMLNLFSTKLQKLLSQIFLSRFLLIFPEKNICIPMSLTCPSVRRNKLQLKHFLLALKLTWTVEPEIKRKADAVQWPQMSWGRFHWAIDCYFWSAEDLLHFFTNLNTESPSLPPWSSRPAVFTCKVP